MDILDGATIFWLIALGLIVGGLIKLTLGKKGVALTVNLACGVLGSVLTGGIYLMLGLPGSMVLALLGSVSILFITNIFYLQPEHADH